MPINYDKWNNIEVSDDEDDTHPNVDTPSLFRWRHKARIEREAAMNEERFNIDREGDKLRMALKKAKPGIDKQNKEKKYAEWQKKEAELATKEKKQPWNVDNLSQEVTTKTIINKPKTIDKSYDQMTDDEKAEDYKNFVDKNEADIKSFGFFRDAEASEKFLKAHQTLICDHTASYMVIWCINLEMEGKNELMKHVARQLICLNFILELAKGMKRHPTDCFPLFYRRLKDRSSSEESTQYHAAFTEELNAFIKRVQDRAVVKKQEQEEELREAQEMEKQERIAASPCGMDPQEVFDNLPEELQNCFIEQDLTKIHELIAQDAQKYLKHMHDCVKSGLWVPAPDSPLYKLLPESQRQAAAETTDKIQEVDEENPDEQATTETTEKSPLIEKEVEAPKSTPCNIDEVD